MNELCCIVGELLLQKTRGHIKKSGEKKKKKPAPKDGPGSHNIICYICFLVNTA